MKQIYIIVDISLLRIFQILKNPSYYSSFPIRIFSCVLCCIKIKDNLTRWRTYQPSIAWWGLMNIFSENNENFLGCVYIRRPHTIYVNSFVRSTISLFTCKMTDLSCTYQVVTIFIYNYSIRRAWFYCRFRCCLREVCVFILS